jgi:hypothetical protein
MARGLPCLHKNKDGAMQRGVLCLLSVSGAELRLCDSKSGDVVVRFTVEVAGQQSGEHLALVEHIGRPDLGLTAGRLKVCCREVAFGIPSRVIEPHIETYVGQAVHMIGGVTLAEMANKVCEMPSRVPIEFEAAESPAPI